MKQTSKKLLLWLYPFDASLKRRVSVSVASWLLPELTTAGQNSLVRHLENEHLLFTDELDGIIKLSLSSHGRLQLQADFPTLKWVDQPWQGDWSVVVFIKAPAGDKNFRYLRSLLMKQQSFQLSRGVYLNAGEISKELINTLHNAYRENVIVYKTNNWQFGDDSIFIGQSEYLKDIISIYSGISNELKILLTKKSNRKTLSDQQKNQFASIFDRFVISFEQDCGIIPYYHPEVISGIKLLQQMQLEINL